MDAPRRTREQLRSWRWFGTGDTRGFSHRSRMQQVGVRREEVMGRPIIGIVNTWSEISTCHLHLRERAESVKRGVLAAGGFPIEMPALSLGEVMVKPTTMLYRNLLAMECEELLRSHPVDGAVLMGGCDKTTPGLLLGAISMDIPAIYLPAGPQLNGHFKGVKVGVGTHTRAYYDELRAGKISAQDWIDLEAAMCRSHGTCNTMGTASTMTSIAEVLGFCLPGATSIPADDAAHPRMAADCGERIVGMVWEDLKPSRIMTAAAVGNAVATYMALGGSTNCAVHLVALARRAGIDLTLDDLDARARDIRVLVNLMPSGDYLMEDFHYAGGLRALLSRIASHLDLSAPTVTGRTLGENIAGARVTPGSEDIIRAADRPISEHGALAVLYGNLAPDGAVIKPAAADPALMQHTGPAVVFEDMVDMMKRIDDPSLDVDERSVLVLKNAGPLGGPGFPEWGNLPIPKKVLAKGIRDMVRISDARMSGTHYGTCVLHVAPEAFIGGPLALVRDGDMIELDVAGRRLHLQVPDAELDRRRAAWVAPPPRFARGYGRMFSAHVTQAPLGCDFDFLQQPGTMPDPDIY
ncbi:MAG: dihydroxy-acid dehydratase [Betaproteobacteria bacterium]|jgi:dihydroxy-acid dehydratase|nr:dihydroxy-acid dehydratase [Betaproteobacteria bacterium]